MSLFDDLKDLQQRLDARIAELAPLVAEYEELQRMSAQIRFDADPARQAAVAAETAVAPAERLKDTSHASSGSNRASTRREQANERTAGAAVNRSRFGRLAPAQIRTLL